MLQVHDGQCGLCLHFGEHDAQHRQELLQIRVTKNAPEQMIEECGHPQHVSLHLVVTPTSGCQGFEPARPN